MSVISRDAFTGDNYATFNVADAAALERAIDQAYAAFPAARTQPPHERAAVLLAAAIGVGSKRDEFIKHLNAEAGKPTAYANVEVDRAISTLTLAAEEARRPSTEGVLTDGFAGGAGHVAIARRFPVGLIYGISPFNFPLNLVVHKVAPAIASGNVMLLKPSPKTPSAAYLLQSILEEAGMIEHQVQTLLLPNDLAGKLAGDDRVKHVSFTGGEAVGWAIKQQAGWAKVTLELGGNAAVIVHDDADLADAAPLIAKAGFGYAGQSCIAVQRVFAQRNVYDELRSQLIAFTRDKIESGNPRGEGVINGPLIDADTARAKGKLLSDSLVAGAKAIVGGELDGQMMQPTILEHTPHDSPAWRDEAFCPLMTLEPYDDFNDALAMANDSRFGLQAGVFTRDLPRTLHAFETLEVGGVTINQVPTFRADAQPYGGVKASGRGREGIRHAMDEYTEPRVLMIRR